MRHHIGRRLLAIAVVTAACTHGATRPSIAPVPVVVNGPPSTFVPTTSDVRITRVIPVREGMTKMAAFRAATEMLTQKYSVDVSDSHAGFLMTSWQPSFIREGAPDFHYRTRVIIRFAGDDWKEVSVRAEANWQRGDEWDIGYDAKVLDDVVSDLTARIGKK